MQPRPDIRDAIEAARCLPERSRPPRCLTRPSVPDRYRHEMVQHALPSADHAIRPGVQVGPRAQVAAYPFRLRGEQLPVVGVFRNRSERGSDQALRLRACQRSLLPPRTPWSLAPPCARERVVRSSQRRPQRSAPSERHRPLRVKQRQLVPTYPGWTCDFGQIGFQRCWRPRHRPYQAGAVALDCMTES